MSEQHQALPISTGPQSLLALTGGLVVLIVLIMLIAKMVFGGNAEPIEKNAPSVAVAGLSPESAAPVNAVSAPDEHIKPVGEVNLAQSEVFPPSEAVAEAPPSPVAQVAQASAGAVADTQSQQPEHSSVVVMTPAPAQPVKQDAGKGSDEEHNVQQVVQGWAAAWSQQNVDEYLAYYAKDFKVQGGKSRSEWESTRRDRVGKAKSIKVEVNNPQVTLLDATHARVTFHQAYRSDAFQDKTDKTLMMVKSDKRWLIQEEMAGN